MTSFYVICGLGLPQSKILGTPMNWKSPEKKFEDLFFLENAGVCVLGPWPWPREGLFSERLSLALDFFVSLALASSLVSSTPSLLKMDTLFPSRRINFGNF